ncbi:MAG: ABC transporter permease [Clostridiales bacterium]|nr:ABC transporter permease [Clostridiales bacterium]
MSDKALVTRDGKGLRRLTQTDEFSTFIPLAVIMLITAAIRPDFLSIRNFSAMFNQIPFIAITALGSSMTLMTGNVDISTGRVAGFAGIMMPMLVVELGWGAAESILLSLACCLAIGFVNGFLVVKFGLPSFITTMGTLYMVGGARYLMIKEYQYNLHAVEGFSLVHAFDQLYLGMPLYFWCMLILFAIAFVLIKRTLWGRRMLATGDNNEVATLVGINSKKMQVQAYMLSALLAGIAGILLTLDMGFGLPENGDGWEFRAIAGCVVGGVSLSGGKASPLGVLIGVTLVFVAENAIIFLGLPTTMRVAVQGALMAGAVLFDIFRQSRKVPE